MLCLPLLFTSELICSVSVQALEMTVTGVQLFCFEGRSSGAEQMLCIGAEPEL